MSPLFCLFISHLGQELNSSGLELDNLNICSILFADDLVLIGKNKESLANLVTITRQFFKTHHLDISKSKSKIMNHDSSTGQTTFLGLDDASPLTLENVVYFIPVLLIPS